MVPSSFWTAVFFFCSIKLKLLRDGAPVLAFRAGIPRQHLDGYIHNKIAQDIDDLFYDLEKNLLKQHNERLVFVFHHRHAHILEKAKRK